MQRDVLRYLAVLVTAARSGQYRLVATASEKSIELPLSGATVSQIRIDYRLGVLFDSGAELSIGGVATLRSSGPSVAIEPERRVNVLAAIDLLWDSVVRADASPEGQLSIEFSKGRTLVIDPDAGYEAWEFVTEDTVVRLVCMPGGGLTTWGVGS